MPTLRTPVGGREGARVRVRVSVSRPVLLRLRRAGQPVPQPVEIDAVLDSGAECTCVDPRVVSQLGLPALGVGLTAAPGTGLPPISILGGAAANTWHKVGLAIVHPSGEPKQDLVVPELDVDSLPLAGFGIDAIVGRDVLALCVLVYDGPVGSVTLAY